jgi:flagellar basal body rod protein FlgG
LVIDGAGYFRTTDAYGENEEFYVRGGTLIVNANNQVCLRVDQFQLMLYPNITIPTDTLKWRIHDDGRVMVWQGGQREPQQQGQLALYRFPAENIPDLAGPVVSTTDETGQPCEYDPGLGNVGWVKQGYREDTPLASDAKAIGFLVAGLVLGWLATVGWR